MEAKETSMNESTNSKNNSKVERSKLKGSYVEYKKYVPDHRIHVSISDCDFYPGGNFVACRYGSEKGSYWAKKIESDMIFSRNLGKRKNNAINYRNNKKGSNK